MYKVIYSTKNKLIGYVTKDELKVGTKIELCNEGDGTCEKVFEIDFRRKLPRKCTEIKNSNITAVLQRINK